MMSKKILDFFKKYRQPFLSGILIGTSYIPFPPWALFFAFVPLWYFWMNQTNLKSILIGGWITQITLSLIGFYWVVTVSQEHGHLPLPVALLILIFFSITAIYYIPLTGLIWYFLSKKFSLTHLSKLLLIAPITALIEAIYPTLFPWNFGYAWLSTKMPGFHLADIIGFQGLSATTIMINFGFLWSHILYQQQKKYKAPALITVGVLLLFNVIGHFHKYESPSPQKTLKVLAVQANIGNLQKEYAQRGMGFRNEITQKYAQLTQDGVEKYQPDFVIWPETAYPYHIGFDLINNWRGAPLARIIRKLKTPMIIGAYHENPQNRRISNSLYTIDEKAKLTDRPYKKTHLLAYGEYLPGGEIFPFLKNMLPQVADFERGTGPRVLNFSGIKIGPQICYEGLYPRFTLDLADLSVDLIVNLTNDSWFGAYSEPQQHLYMTLARAIEVRKPLIRSTNTGITTAILPDGTLLERSPIFKEWQGYFEIPIVKNTSATFYQNYPWLIHILLLLLIAIIIGKDVLNNNRNRGFQ